MTSAYEFLIRAYTEKSIPKVAATPFALTDVVGHLLSVVGGDGDNSNTAQLSSFLYSPGDEGAYWKGQPNFRSIDGGIGYIQLSGGGRALQNMEGAAARGTSQQSHGTTITKGGPGFFYIKPKERPLNSQVGAVAGTVGNGIPVGAAEYDTCVWEAGDEWLTYLPDNSQHSRIALLVQAPNQVRSARTKKIFEANRQLRFDVTFFGKDFGGERGAFRLHWGDDAFAFVWREGSAPEIERMGEDGKWSNWHTLEGAPKATFGGEWKVYICRVNGALVIRLEGSEFSGQWDFAESVTGESPSDIRLVDVEWPRGRVNARAYNSLFSLGIAILDHAALDKKSGKRKPFQNQVVRDTPRPYNVSSSNTTVLLAGNTGGWQRNGTRAKVLVETLEPSADTKGIPVARWTCTLTASPDGIDSPCVAFVFANYEGALINPEPEFIDVARAGLKGSFSSSEPPQSAGSELRLDLSRNLLADIHPNWQAYIHEFHPIELAIRRQYSDGTSSPWVGRFKGYQLDSGKQNPRANEFRMSLVCESAARRLQKPHAYIDHKYYPMDLLYFRQGGRRLYVSQCVQEILRIEMGAAEAARFNGNGDPLRFLEDDHPPLIATNGDYMGLFPLSQPLVKNGFTFAPLWKQGPIDWIKKLLGYDRTMFFYGFLPEEEESQDPNNPVINWPFPICGRYEPIIGARETHRLADALYNAGDEDSPLTSIDSRVRADSLYNDFLSTATPEGASHPMLPDLLSAREQLPASDRNSAAHSWPRTLLTEENWLYKGGVLGHPLAGLAASAFLAKREFENKDPNTPTLVFRGHPKVDWGDKIRPERLILPSGPRRSDPDVIPSDTEFRVLGVEENYNFETSGIGQYMTTARIAPLSVDGY